MLQFVRRFRGEQRLAVEAEERIWSLVDLLQHIERVLE
jgi:Holliday junction resolvase